MTSSGEEIKALFIWRKVVQGRSITSLPEIPVPWASQRFLHFVTKPGCEPFTGEKKLARLSGSPFVMVGSPSYPDQPFSGSTQSKQEIMSICERCWVGQMGERSVKVTRLGAGVWLTPLPGTGFLHINAAYNL